MTRSVSRPRGAALFVYGTSAAMLVAVLAAIALWGRNLPMSEDWITVAPLTGNEPSLLTWLWAQNNEHRMPLPRLLYLMVLKVSGGDFRSGMVANALALGAVSFAMIRVAQRLRGGVIHYSDAFFPIILLNLGHWENLLWGWQIQFSTSVGLTCALLLAITVGAGLPAPRAALVAAVSMVLLPLSGANGLVIALAFSPWFAFLGLRTLTSARAEIRPTWPGRLLLTASATTVLLGGLYFVGYQQTRWYPATSGVLATAKMAAKLIAFGFGPAASRFWPLSVLAVAILLISSALVLLLPVRRGAGAEPFQWWLGGEWPRRIGLLLFIAVSIGLSLAIGWGRAGVPPVGWGLPLRYALLNVPALCAAYFVWMLYGPDRLRARVPWTLFAIVAVLIPLNTRAGFYWRDWYIAEADIVERDVAAGVPLPTIAERHQNFLLHWNRDLLLSRLQMLQQAGMGPFRSHQDQAGLRSRDR